MPAAPPIKYGLGYRSRTITLTINPNPKTDPNPNLFKTIKTDTEIKFGIDLYIQGNSVGQGVRA